MWGCSFGKGYGIVKSYIPPLRTELLRSACSNIPLCSIPTCATVTVVAKARPKTNSSFPGSANAVSEAAIQFYREGVAFCHGRHYMTVAALISLKPDPKPPA